MEVPMLAADVLVVVVKTPDVQDDEQDGLTVNWNPPMSTPLVPEPVPASIFADAPLMALKSDPDVVPLAME
jgi:hypothetical protein